MRKVFKYVMEDVVSLPLGHRIIMTAKQDGLWCIWVEFEDVNESNTVEVAFKVFGTGHRISKEWVHLHSYIERPFVWHIYWSFVNQ